MNKNEFKEFCKKEFYKRGYQKIKNMYYLPGLKNVLSGIKLQKSDYSDSYYVNCYFFIGNFEDISKASYPTNYDYDIRFRILVMSKTQKCKGKLIETAAIEYGEYTEEELRYYFDKEFENRILPPVNEGKQYILDNLNTLYVLDLRREEVTKKLQE